MGARKPTELRVLEGNPGKRPLPDAPKYPPLTTTPPKGLMLEGRRLWERVTNAKPTIRSCRPRSTPACSRCADGGIATWPPIAASNAAAREDMLIAQAAFDRYDRLSKRFGLTPRDRACLDMGKVEDHEDDPLAEILAAAERRKQERRRLQEKG